MKSRIGNRELALTDLSDRVSDCIACPRLVSWREQVAREKRKAYQHESYWGRGVPGWGDPKARIMVIGLAPAAHGANRTGRMFTGDRSGDWLYRAMYRAGLATQPTAVDLQDGLELVDAWVTSPVKCAPPANKPTPAERDTCAHYMLEELEILSDVTVAIALGGFGYREAARILGIEKPPKFGHGVEAPAPGGRTLIASYHVSQQNTFTGRLTEEMLDSVFERATELARQGS